MLVGNTLEKILVNLITNYKNPKFYHIKIVRHLYKIVQDSQHFKNYIAINENAVKLLEAFGFAKAILIDGEFYCMNTEVPIDNIKEMQKDFKKLILNYNS